jgi:hypothetical protein
MEICIVLFDLQVKCEQIVCKKTNHLKPSQATSKKVSFSFANGNKKY